MSLNKSSMLESSLLDFDRKHIWHPYTSLIDPLPVYPVHSAKGVYLRLEDGRKLIDGMSSWWCAVHGYNHPKLNEALQKQMERMSHVMFGGLTHEPAIRLCQKLVEITPAGLDRVFLCDSGSIAVEVALKMAFQYWHSLGRPEKKRLMTLRKGYHGDTFGAMSVCDPVSGMHHLFSHFMQEQIFVAAPLSTFEEDLRPEDEAELEAVFRNHHQETAAFILEPIVQGAGGMRIYSPAYLQKVKALCQQYEVLLIADEIATGFGRTGKRFACEHASVSPDILCLGKALTGGTMTSAATLCTAAVGQTICEGEAGVFMHGPTFMANPLACSVSIASINLLESTDWQSKVMAIEKILKEGLLPLTEHLRVKEVRVLGAIGVIECQQSVDVAAIQQFFVGQGVWIRPFRNLIYIMPPFIITAAELEQLCEVMRKSLLAEEHFLIT